MIIKNAKRPPVIGGPIFYLYTLILVCAATAGLSWNSQDLSGVVMPAQESWIQLAALGISSGLSIFKGIRQKNAARDLERNNPRPRYQVARSVIENVGNARKIASEGLPDAVRNNFLTQLGLNTSNALRSNLLYGGRGVNTSSILRSQNEALLDLNAQDAQATRNNQQVLMNANEDLAAEERRKFEFNEAGRYQENVNNLAALRRAGDENIYAGLGSVLGGVASGNIKIPGMTGKPLTAKSAVTAAPTIDATGARQTLQTGYNNIIAGEMARRNTPVTLAIPRR